ncbi:hypothetical protein [Clostridium tagluense]|uniref:hypothetical protein n=1 Tax=Clostridium tagluense TaxID=360422 RepID=UPI001C6F2BBC|nr:hypothetical protein [Clostridium tagluense]MBW9157006.1 hypothetical protein [Clostridium tagluense]WLC64993.1 hypothetical protein KTC93_19460 [Clostridium tagluense]
MRTNNDTGHVRVYKIFNMIYFNTEGQTTAIGGGDILICLIPKAAYSEVEKIEV